MTDCTCPEPRGTSWSLSCEIHGQSRIRALERDIADLRQAVDMLQRAQLADASHLVSYGQQIATWDAIHADTRKRVTKLERRRATSSSARRKA